MSITFDRRSLLGCAALLALAPAALRAGEQGAGLPPLLLSAAGDPDNGHWLVGLSLAASGPVVRFQQPLPARGHHVAVNAAHGLYVAVARRPGDWLVLGSLDDGTILEEIRVPAGRHLYGHGIFTSDGRYFYTTESDYHDMVGDSGLVVEWAVVNDGGRIRLQRGREFPSGGVGPHELVLLPDGATLAVANGGLRTHPDSEREVLNADTMRPSLAYIDRDTGAIVEQVFPPADLHQCSIRHLDVSAEGRVAFGMQFQGEPFREVPLVATHRRGEAAFTFMTAPPLVQGRMEHYVGSVRFSGGGDYIAASCPRGNLVTLWTATGDFLRAVPARDGCGVQATSAGFFVSTGVGRVIDLDLREDKATELKLPDDWLVFWDNHLSALEVAV